MDVGVKTTTTAAAAAVSSGNMNTHIPPLHVVSHTVCSADKARGGQRGGDIIGCGYIYLFFSQDPSALNLIIL